MEKEYLKLKEQIKYHNFLYYELAKPIITDKEYDELLKKLELIELNNPEYKDKYSPTSLVGGYLNKKFTKVKHKEGMLSLKNSYSEEDILEWKNQIKKEFPDWNNGVVLVENKLDGISCSLHYEKGKLIMALTRGDGEYGEDITENVLRCFNVPIYLQSDYTGEIRGELLIFKEQFKKLNKNNEYANSRNLCSGTMRQLNSDLVAERKIIFAPYYLLNTKNDSLLEDIKEIHKLGFETYTDSKCVSIDNILDEILLRTKNKDKLPMDIDGLVFKVNDKKLHNSIGYTSKFPKWAIAYKFDTEKKITLLKSVDYQIGKTGIITPVANLDEIELAGTKVSRASLHNFDEIKRKDIRIGDYVVVEKSAEIIPYIVRVDLEKRKSTKDIEVPKHCPFCNSELKKDGVYLVCKNNNCKELIIQQIIYFSSKDCMNIEGLSEKTIRKFNELGLLNNIIDIYNLKDKKDELITLKGFGLKSIEKILNSIELSKQNKFESVLNSLSINNVGRSMSKRLVKEFKDIDTLLKVNKEQLLKVEGIADLSATEILNWLQSEENINFINKLKSFGVNLKSEIKTIKENIFTNKKVCITGTFNSFKRDEIIKELELSNAIVTNSISKKTDYLIYGEQAGSKLNKAKTFSIKLINEEEFKKEINK